MPTAVIGALRVSLDLGTAGWRRGLDSAANDATTAAARFQKIGNSMTRTGGVLSAAITAPLLGIGIAAVKMSGDFEAAMNKVAISTGATAAEMKRMNDMALQLGKDTVFSASEAANAMDELGKQGVPVADILNGAAEAAVHLAAATGSGLEPAATAVADSMHQFHLTAKQLPDVVNQITGAVNESKLDFNDYQLAIAQAGGVAGGLGVSFKDFNTALAATSSLFSSGSDAGTSFKTFLTRLVPASKQAGQVMQQYGLQFFDAQGKMKSMAVIAEMLRDKLGGLSNQAKNKVLTTIFGQDAMRTAIGLMDQGAAGLEKVAANIAKTDAAAQSAQRMKGLNGQMEQLRGSLETLAIQIGQTGLLQSVTWLVTKFTDFLDVLTSVSPATAQVVVAVAAVAAAIGPVMLVLGPIVSGIGSLITLFSGWAASLSAASVAAGGFGALLVPILPIIAAVAGAVALAYAAWQHWDTIGPMLSGFWDTLQTTFGPPLMALFEAVRSTLVDLWNGPFGTLLKAAGLAVAEFFQGLFGGASEAASAFAKFGAAVASVLGPVIAGLFNGFLALVGSTFKVVGDILNALAAFLMGEFSGAWKYLKKAAGDAITGLGNIIEGLVPGALGALQRLVEGAKSWIVDKLAAVMNAALHPIETVKNAFFNLYDAVVGHSYVPDMVDGIAGEMARLDAVMVTPAGRATKKVADQFKDLRDKLKPLLDELFPEIRASLDQANKLDLIERARKAGAANGGLTDAQATEARQRVFKASGSDEGMTPEERMDAWSKIQLVPDHLNLTGKALDDLKVKLPDLSAAAQDTTAKMVESFAGMAKDVVGSLRGMVADFKKGDILGGITGLLDIVQQVTGIIRGNTTPRQTVNTVTPYGGGRALGGPVVPGKRYRVGERGPEWLEVNTPGRVVPDSAGGRAGNVYHISGNLLTPEFWDEIQRRDDEASLRGAHGGAQLAADRSAQRQRRSLYG